MVSIIKRVSVTCISTTPDFTVQVFLVLVTIFHSPACQLKTTPTNTPHLSQTKKQTKTNKQWKCPGENDYLFFKHYALTYIQVKWSIMSYSWGIKEYNFIDHFQSFQNVFIWVWYWYNTIDTCGIYFLNLLWKESAAISPFF